MESNESNTAPLPPEPELPSESTEQFLARVNGLPCVVCSDPLAREVVEYADAEGAKHLAHALCFWRARADVFEQQAQTAHQALCAIVASKGGIATVTRANIERAALANYRVEATPCAEGIRYALPKRSVELVKSLPSGLVRG